VTTFAVLRFLAGLGLGACLPTALAYMTEYAPRGRGGSAVTRMMTGYHVGAVLTALMWAKLPESEAYLAVARETSGGGAAAKVRSSDVVKRRYLWVSIGLWVASFMGLLLVYGLNTWLPKIMDEAGYSIDASLVLLLTLNVGAVTGLVVAGRISDSRGNKPTVMTWFGLAALFLAALSIKIESGFVVYLAVFLAGVFVFSAQVLVYAFVGHLYPAEVRGTALGLAAGVGRLGAIVGPFLGGALVSAGIAYPWGFYAFAVAALLAVAALAVVPAHMREAA
jgi:MFS family permease